MSQPHETLIAWQRADDLCVSVYELTRTRFPRDERFALTAQLRRAGYSVAANIVEGYAHPSKRWRLRYLRISVGSLAELGYGLHLARRLDYLSSDEHADLTETVRRVAAPLHGLIAHVRGTLETGNE